MKTPEMILGYAEYDGDKYPFVYENGVLNLLPGTEVEWKKQISNLYKSFQELSKFRIKHEWIENKYIKGTTIQHKKVIFITKGDGSNNNGFIQYEIQVIYEYQSDSKNGELINGLVITADEIDYFFHPSRVFSREVTFNENGALEEITIKTGREHNHTVQCGSYKIGDISVNIEISAYSTFSTRSESPLSAHSQIYFEFDQAIDIDKALDVVYHQELFLRYICNRKNIYLSSVNVFCRNEKGLRRTEGKIYIISEEVNETNKKKVEQVLTMELLEEKVAPIFGAIADGTVYLDHICECIDDKNSYSIARIILIFAAFEREYNNRYSSQPIRSEEYLRVKADVLVLLEDYEKKCPNAKSRKYIKGFKRIIDSSDNSLSERIKNSINNNFEIIKTFLNYNYQTHDEDLVEEISQRMNTMRNDIAHGNLDITIEPIHLSDLKILEILVYVIRLGSLGISVKSIQKSICRLFRLNIRIPDNDEPKA